MFGFDILFDSIHNQLGIYDKLAAIPNDRILVFFNDPTSILNKYTNIRSEGFSLTATNKSIEDEEAEDEDAAAKALEEDYSDEGGDDGIDDIESDVDDTNDYNNEDADSDDDAEVYHSEVD